MDDCEQMSGLNFMSNWRKADMNGILFFVPIKPTSTRSTSGYMITWSITTVVVSVLSFPQLILNIYRSPGDGITGTSTNCRGVSRRGSILNAESLAEMKDFQIRCWNGLKMMKNSIGCS